MRQPPSSPASSTAGPRRSARLAATAHAQSPEPRRNKPKSLAHAKPQKQTLPTEAKTAANNGPKSDLKSQSPPMVGDTVARPTTHTPNTPQDPPGVKQSSRLPLLSAVELERVKGKSNTKVDEWVESLQQSEPLEPDLVSIRDPMAPQDAGVAPGPSTDQYTSVQQTSEGPSTKARRNPPGQSVRVKLEYQLAMRNVESDATITADPYTEVIKSAISQTPAVTKNQLAVIRSLLRSFLDKTEDEAMETQSDADRWRILTRLRQNLNDMLPDTGSFTQTPGDFKRDQRKSLRVNVNEAVLQRTLLMSAIDRERLRRTVFDFNCEGQWVVPSDLQLPVTGDKAAVRPLAAPRPDLEIAFKSRAILKHLPPRSGALEPGPLFHCIHPDGSRDRSFPFLFIEAKRRNDSLNEASWTGMHAASQALYNMYMCMEKAGRLDLVEHIRVFSLSINAQMFMLRSHQIEQNEIYGTIAFVHEEVLDATMYDGQSLNTSIRSILNDYARPVLYKVIVDLYTELLRPYMEREAVSKERLDEFLAKHTFDPADLRDEYSSNVISDASDLLAHQPDALPAQQTVSNASQNHRPKRHKASHGEVAAPEADAALPDMAGVTLQTDQAGI